MSAFGHVEREAALRAEVERLRAERNLLREMFNSAEKELAAERERCGQLVEDWVRPAMGDRVEPLLAAIRKGEP